MGVLNVRNILPSSFQIFQGLAKNLQDLPIPCQDLASSGKIFKEIKDRIQDLVKTSKINPRSYQEIRVVKSFLRSWQDIQDVKRWDYLYVMKKFPTHF